MPFPSSIQPHESGAQRTGSVINGLTPSPVESVAEGSLKDQCEAIFRHPLFPLMRLLIEKLEEATLTSVTPSREAINSELEGLVRKIQQNHSSVNTGSPDIDDLMTQGVNVLRLHLFELEKVNELCRDFCNRYTDCLRRNLHTDQILRGDGMDSDNSNGSFPPPNVESIHCANFPVTSNSAPRPYEVVTPPQGMVPHSMTSPPVPAESSVYRNDQYLGNAAMSPVSGHSHYDEGRMDHDPDDPSSPKGSRSNRRGVLPKDAINIMKTWLFQHIVHPYPTEDEKRVLALQTQLSLLQVNNWFINARRRILQPMLDSSNPVGHRPKKGMQSRPVDPFWSESAAQAHSSSATSENGSGAEYRDTDTGNGSDDDARDDESDDDKFSHELQQRRSQAS
ncbi:homeobox protein PKNOX2-like isoform X2 [Paramacrobiotus metropolitanus]|nr:homeobox protein PKNOX2-like isoform X2 [Paramacrobiotus metropolitanus]XP_055338761.1 homeobox protein PKNOX2-like isoform X2 [Paramacrobiotus metropolitanus]XP_055338762.1 homeobox protein PKNOX2-like isoform X2 [Paramacrobiotus metropolitanus]XP_055338763.1 homeobox protein PKNOX2-like isoform X2 [Paramacrobiotus metropolitanus]XP_055338764.1 homeobox protein PKNOX2-like isoform X2 [Paramacrobiotus metropolitanus]XP_055338765.1 homeobox protein PKNOX2-like isoform X2 [Paramacrobiotus met